MLATFRCVTGFMLLFVLGLGIPVFAEPASSRLAIRNVHMIDGTGKDLGIGTILVDGTHIKAIGQKAFRADREIDGSGLFAVPGYIDAHLHLLIGVAPASGNCHDVLDQVSPALVSMLESGFTTVMSLGDPLTDISTLRDRLAEGTNGPRLLVVGPVLVAKGHPSLHRTGFCSNAQEIDSPRQARTVVANLAKSGVDGIKIVYDELWSPRLDDDSVAAIVAEAHSRGLLVYAHVQTERDALQAVRLGVDRLAHLPVEKLSADAIAILGKRRIPIVTTVHLHAPIRKADGQFISHSGREIASDRLPEQEKRVEDMRDNIVALRAAGIPVAFGTDRYRGSDVVENPVGHEVESLPPSLSGTDQLRLLTADAARFIGREKDVGRLASGATADIILLAGDPRTDAGQLRNIVAIFAQGRLVLDRRGRPSGDHALTAPAYGPAQIADSNAL
jgi:imidazolonepropionase-like amidohydrolase